MLEVLTRNRVHRALRGIERSHNGASVEHCTLRYGIKRLAFLSKHTHRSAPPAPSSSLETQHALGLFENIVHANFIHTAKVFFRARRATKRRTRPAIQSITLEDDAVLILREESKLSNR